VEAAPGIYTVAGGAGQALALNEDGSFNSETNPAPRGSRITLFATGEGRTALPLRVSIARLDAEVLAAAPGTAGLPGALRIDTRIPAGFVPTGALAVQLTVGAAASQPGVTIAVR
jgi:uncharacterized protein (TIGR03437 family)